MALQTPLRIWLGWSNAFLVPAEEGYILIDAGIPGVAGRVFDVLARHDIPPEAIRLIVVTHVHLDHVGALKAIQARCGAPVMVHAAEADLLAKGTVVVPGGTTLYGVVATTTLKALNALLPVRFAPHMPEHIVTDEVSLADFGLDARVLNTPGHTLGSITVLGASGDAFIGDLAVNHYPFGLGPIYPPFGDDGEAIYASWRKLLDAGARRIYPGHGAPFDAGLLADKLEQHTDVEFNVGISPEETIDRLRYAVDRRTGLKVYFSQKDFWGKFDNHSFLIRRLQKTYRNSFAPVLRGHVEETRRGSTITGRFQIPLPLKLFMFFWLCVAGFMALSVVVSTLSRFPSPDEGRVGALFFMLIMLWFPLGGLLILLFGLRMRASEAKTISDFFLNVFWDVLHEYRIRDQTGRGGR